MVIGPTPPGTAVINRARLTDASYFDIADVGGVVARVDNDGIGPDPFASDQSRLADCGNDDVGDEGSVVGQQPVADGVDHGVQHPRPEARRTQVHGKNLSVGTALEYCDVTQSGGSANAAAAAPAARECSGKLRRCWCRPQPRGAELWGHAAAVPPSFSQANADSRVLHSERARIGAAADTAPGGAVQRRVVQEGGRRHATRPGERALVGESPAKSADRRLLRSSAQVSTTCAR
jgi:hypothetical protein